MQPSPARFTAAIRRLRWQLGALALLPALSGCVSLSVRVHPVPRTAIAPNLMSATLPQLVDRLKAQDSAIQGLSATVTITATTGGQHTGEVKDIPTFAGYIVMRRPADLHVILLLPVLRSRALDMVTNGTDFKLLIPPRNRAITGTDKEVERPETVAGPANPNAGLETIRPYIIRDALLIPPITPEDFLSMTESSRTLPPVRGRKDGVEEPEYDLTILRRDRGETPGQPVANATGQVLDRVRVIRIGRISLQPYAQDIYDSRGHVVTTVQYSNYQRFGDIDYPTSILITRPIDEYSLRIDISKLQVNPKLDDEQFALKIPDNVPVKKM